MPPAVDSPCQPWVTADQVRSCAPCDGKNVSDDTYAQWAMVASTWLWRITGRRFTGTCNEYVRPIPRNVWGGSWGTTGGHYWDGYGYPAPWNFDSCRGTYGFMQYGPRGENVFECTLGFDPIRAVQQVKIDGQVLDPTTYRVDDSRFLVRLDGNPWPAVNDLAKPDTEPNTWSVSFTYGDDPPVDGITAARVLACELVKADTDDDTCRLPKNTQTVTRQGIAMVFSDPQRMAELGVFGIREVDGFVQSINPHKLTRRATVVNIDLPRAVRRTGTTPGS